MPPSLHLMLIVFLTSAAALSAAGAQASQAEEIRADSVRAHLEFLASDLMEGREAGTRGYDIAAAYVASQFQQIGLKPGGDQGYFHRVPLRRSVLVKNSVTLQVRAGGEVVTFTDADHVAARPSATEPEQHVEASCVFAGYGIVSPELRIDDYKGLDVRGKFVVVLGGPAPGLPSEIAGHLSSTDELRATAAKRGAAGLLIIYTPALEKRWPFKQLAPVYVQPQYEWFDAALSQGGAQDVRVLALVDPTAASALFRGARRTLQDVMKEASTRRPRGFELRSSATFTRRSTHADASSANVVGMLPGTDPSLRDEVIVFTSHLDHVGIGVPKNGDAIYNGALDNAAGIAVMLEVARVLAAEPGGLKRSVAFVATTAEEKGLIGADYFARKPSGIRREQMVGVINLDGAMPFFDLVDVIGFGADSSTLGESLRRAAASLHITVSPDPWPDQALITRSDHYPFIRQGIPGIFLIAGIKPTPDGKDPKEISDRWTAQHLHQPSDDLNQDFDYGHMVKWGELFRRWTQDAANAPQRPLWYSDDYFGKRYAPAELRTAQRPQHQGTTAAR
jgi:hypothetical protein